MRASKVVTFSALLAGWAFFASAETTQENGIPSLRQATSPPDWVELREPEIPDSIPEGDVSGGEYALDFQLQWHIPSQSRFYRSSVLILGDAGLEDAGSRSFTFDPSYETLEIHWVRLLREGEIIEQFSPETLRVFASEEDHSFQALDGSKTALVVLQDVRVGDVVEYACTYVGENPAIGDEAVIRRNLAGEAPFHRRTFRILARPDRELQIRSFGEKDPVDHGVNGLGLREWRLDLRDHPGIHWEGDIPEEFRVYPALHVSSFSSWADVVDWGLELYPTDPPLPADVMRRLDEIQAEIEDPRDRVREALVFVQENVRYLALSMGNGAYQPRAPELVWQRRFGDCKDKSMLLTSMLRKLGVNAWPALVNTEWHGGIGEFLPSPYAFDHVIVCVELDGTTYWLDGTSAPQVAPLDHLPTEPHGFALVIREGDEQLTAVAPPPEFENSVSAFQDLVLAATGEYADFTIVTRYRGHEAESVLSHFRSDSRSEIGRDYTEFWSDSYPGLELKGSVEMEVDTATGEVVTREHYRIDDPWKDSESSGVPELGIYPDTLYDYLPNLRGGDRDSPYDTGEPVRIEETIRVELGEPWHFGDDVQEIDGPGIDYRSESTEDGGVILAKYEYVLSEGAIPPEDFGEFRKTLDRIYDDLGWSLTQDSGDTGRPLESINPIAVLCFVCGTVLGLVAGGLALLITFLPRPPVIRPEGIGWHLEGLAGWLVLPAFGLFAAPVFAIAWLVRTSGWIFHKEYWENLESIRGTAMIRFAEMVPYLVGGNLVFAGFISLFPLFLFAPFFRKSRYFPTLMILLLVVMGLYEAGMAYIHDKGSPILAMILVAVWIWYFLVSKRVKVTFRR